MSQLDRTYLPRDNQGLECSVNQDGKLGLRPDRWEGMIRAKVLQVRRHVARGGLPMASIASLRAGFGATLMTATGLQ
jgi:hypothetical protein